MKLQAPPRRIWLPAVMAGVLLAAVGVWLGRADGDAPFTTVAERGPLRSTLTVTGVLKPTESLTYRSPVIGREIEVVELAREGARVEAGALLMRFSTNELQKELERAQQELRQLKLDLQLAHGERQDAEAQVKSATQGEGALAVEEAQTRLQLAQLKAERLRKEVAELQPLMKKGYITREELGRSESDLAQAVEELGLARKRATIVQQLTQPREQQRANLQLAQRVSQLENVVGRVQEAEVRVHDLEAMIADCAVYAKGPGLVVYEEVLNASPRRKVRVGDRVTPTQGIVTIPNVSKMIVESSVSEAEVHRVTPGQRATVGFEAYPNLRLAGRVTRVGTLATATADRSIDDKRFELIVELDSTTPELRPEMTSRADIAVGDRDDVLRVPVAAIAQRGQDYIVNVVTPNGIVPRAVTLGEANDRYVEITSGLQAGERLLLGEPRGGAQSGRPSGLEEGINGQQPR